MFLKATLKQHVARLHVDEVLIVDTLRRNFATPRVVIENKGARSEQAIYDIPVGGHPCLLVAIKYRGWLRTHLIVTFYGIEETQIPQGRVLWGKR